MAEWAGGAAEERPRDGAEHLVTTDGGAGGDQALEALRALVAALDSCADELRHARARAQRLVEQRQTGRAWLDIVSAESRPLVVERISTVLATLATAGSAWRREQARALHAEQVSINRIAALFGVTRQRISALLRDRPDEDATPAID